MFVRRVASAAAPALSRPPTVARTAAAAAVRARSSPLSRNLPNFNAQQAQLNRLPLMRFFASEVQAAAVRRSEDDSRFLVNLDGTLYSIGPNDTVAQFAREVGGDKPEVAVRASPDSELAGAKFSGGNRMADALTMGCVVEHNSKAFTLAAQAPLSGQAAAAAAAAGGQLYAYRPSRAELDELKKEFIPLFQLKRELDAKAEKRTTAVLYAGLGYLCVQWAFLARLTWWEFNWDIMEPVTYFITIGTGVLAYAYFAIQKSEYTYDHLRGVILSKRMFKNYIRNKFPIDRYFALEDKIHKASPELLAEIEYDLEQEEFEKNLGVSNAKRAD